MNRKYKDITGNKYGRLTVQNIAKEKASDGQYKWECLCNCGKTHIATGGELRRGKVKSCGCYNIDVATKHGGTKTKTYSIWCNVKNRCLGRSNSRINKDYSERGITICKEWLDFSVFLKDMGKCPGPNYSIERINNNLGYCKSNCKWILINKQAKNRRSSIPVEYNNKKYLCLLDLCEDLNLSYSMTSQRIRRGWTIVEAITIPKGTRIK